MRLRSCNLCSAHHARVGDEWTTRFAGYYLNRLGRACGSRVDNFVAALLGRCKNVFEARASNAAPGMTNTLLFVTHAPHVLLNLLLNSRRKKLKNVFVFASGRC